MPKGSELLVAALENEGVGRIFDGWAAAEGRLRQLASEVLMRAEDTEERRGRVRHRAPADAQAHPQMWRDIRARVERLVR